MRSERNPEHGGDALFTVLELSRRWRVTTRTVYEEVRRGALRPVRVGNRLRFHPTEIDRYETTTPPQASRATVRPIEIRRRTARNLDERLELRLRLTAIVAEISHGNADDVARTIAEGLLEDLDTLLAKEATA